MRTAAVLGGAALAVYLASTRTIVSTDTITNVLLSYSLLRDRDPFLDEFLGGPLAFWSFPSAGHLVSWYPPGTSILALPFTALGAALGIEPPLGASVTIVGRTAAAAMTAGSVGVVFLLARRVAGPADAAVVAFLYAFGTASWPTSAGALWQHGPGQLLLALGMLTSWPGSARPIAAGAMYGLAAIVRHMNGFLALAALGSLAQRLGWRGTAAFIVGALPALAILLAYNLAAFGRPTNPYYVPFELGNVIVGLAGQLISPSRGVLVYSPFLALAIVGAIQRLRVADEAGKWLRWQAAGAIGVLLFHSIYVEWWGGYSYGNRYLAELLPLLAVGLAYWMRVHPRARDRVMLAAAGAWALLLNGTGALLYDWPRFPWETTLGVPHDQLMWRADLAQWAYTIANAGTRIDLLTIVSLATLLLAAVAFARAAGGRTDRA